MLDLLWLSWPDREVSELSVSMGKRREVWRARRGRKDVDARGWMIGEGIGTSWTAGRRMRRRNFIAEMDDTLETEKQEARIYIAKLPTSYA